MKKLDKTYLYKLSDKNERSFNISALVLFLYNTFLATINIWFPIDLHAEKIFSR